VPAGRKSINIHERRPQTDATVTRIPVFITLLAA
jgi:hypothetical protein